MKNICLLLMLAISSVAFGQSACETKIEPKNYTVKFGVKGGEKKDIKGAANGNEFAYNIEIKNTSKIKLEFEAALWGTKGTSTTVVLLGKTKVKIAGPGSSITIPGNMVTKTLDEIKLTVKKVDCEDASKGTFNDPNFYKAKIQ